MAIIRMSLAAESSAITTPAEARPPIIALHPITGIYLILPAAAAPFMAARLTACTAARSAASVMEARRGHFPRAASQVLAEVSGVAEDSTVAEATAAAATAENDAGSTAKRSKEFE